MQQQTVVVRWPSWSERRTGDRVVLGSNPAGITSLWNFDNCVYPTLQVSFGGDTAVGPFYAKGSKTSHDRFHIKFLGNLTWIPPLSENDNSKINPVL